MVIVNTSINEITKMYINFSIVFKPVLNHYLRTIIIENRSKSVDYQLK